MKVYNKNELFEVDGILYEKETAFPSPTGDQNAIMLHWNGTAWELSGWNAFVDGDGKIFNGWELLYIANQDTILNNAITLMGLIERGE